MSEDVTTHTKMDLSDEALKKKMEDPEYKAAYIAEVKNASADRVATPEDYNRELLADSFLQNMFEGFAERLFDTAEKSGWHKDETFGDKIALIHSELSEALEEFRNAKPFDLIYYTGKTDDGDEFTSPFPFRKKDDGTVVLNKVEGIAAELADAIIRIFDLSVQLNIPVVDAMFRKALYNETRPYRHGGKVI